MRQDDIATKRELLTWLHGKYAEHLPMWVITDHPRDYPDDYVARLHFSLPVPQPMPIVLTCSSLDAIRSALPHGLVKLERHELDDPKIVEVWL